LKKKLKLKPEIIRIVSWQGAKNDKLTHVSFHPTNTHKHTHRHINMDTHKDKHSDTQRQTDKIIAGQARF
jgi:hypothetical protein